MILKTFFCVTFLVVASGALSNAFAETPPPIPLELPTPPTSAGETPPPPPVADTPTPLAPAPIPVTDTTASVAPAPTDTTAPAKEEPAKTTDQAPPTTQAAADQAIPGWKGSIMFLPNEAKALQDAINESFSAPDPSLLEASSTQTEQSSSFMPNLMANLAPVYYLSSILYVSGNHWAVWVNGIQYSSETGRFAGDTLEGLEVEAVSPQLVRFKSKVRLLDRISPNWQEKFSTDEDGRFVAKHTKNLFISKDKDFITFTLQPNQHIAFSTMEISEGPSQ